MAINWKDVAHHQRYIRRLAEQQEVRLKARLGEEHAKRIMLVNAMVELLPRIGLSQDGEFCRGCESYIDGANEHQDCCPYVTALAAVAIAGRSVEDGAMTHYQMYDRQDHGTGFTPNEQRIADLEAALQQIVWLADATEPLSVKGAEIARKALGDPKPV